MKYYMFLILGLLFFSCQLDIDDENTHLERIPVFDVQVPQSIIVNADYPISFKYALVNGCYTFHDFTYEIVNNKRIVTAFAEIADTEYCTQEYREELHTFSFTPQETGTYIFKFWIGYNDQGGDEYEIHEITVE